MVKSDLIIRPVEIKDAEALNSIRRHQDVFINLMALPSETILSSERFLQGLGRDDHMFCAEILSDGSPRIIGVAGLHIKSLLRQRHCAEIGMMVHPDFFRQQIGSALMKAITGLSDQWLMLKRLELSVYVDNVAAIKLYEKFDFVTEGVMKYAGIRYGQYADILLMARYNQA